MVRQRLRWLQRTGLRLPATLAPPPRSVAHWRHRHLQQHWCTVSPRPVPSTVGAGFPQRPAPGAAPAQPCRSYSEQERDTRRSAGQFTAIRLPIPEGNNICISRVGCVGLRRAGLTTQLSNVHKAKRLEHLPCASRLILQFRGNPPLIFSGLARFSRTRKILLKNK